jgi:hypothetical protein
MPETKWTVEMTTAFLHTIGSSARMKQSKKLLKCYPIAIGQNKAIPCIRDSWAETKALTERQGLTFHCKMQGASRYALSLFYLYGGGVAEFAGDHAPLETIIAHYLNQMKRQIKFSQLTAVAEDKFSLDKAHWFFTIDPDKIIELQKHSNLAEVILPPLVQSGALHKQIHEALQIGDLRLCVSRSPRLAAYEETIDAFAHEYEIALALPERECELESTRNHFDSSPAS